MARSIYSGFTIKSKRDELKETLITGLLEALIPEQDPVTVTKGYSSNGTSLGDETHTTESIRSDTEPTVRKVADIIEQYVKSFMQSEMLGHSHHHHDMPALQSGLYITRNEISEGSLPDDL